MKHAVLTERVRREDAEGLMSLGYEIIRMKDNPLLFSPLSSHTDLSVFFLRKKVFTTEEYAKENREAFVKIEALGYDTVYVKTAPRSPYPADTPLCILNLGDSALIANTRTAAPEILEYAMNESISVHHTNQGYSKCTSLFAGGIITADKGLIDRCRSASITVVEISPGGIILPPYDYGFIGGCSGVDGQKIFFTGQIESHSDYSKIKQFTKSFGFECISLSDGPLLDIGSIFFI